MCPSFFYIAAPRRWVENKKATGTFGGFSSNPSLTLATRGGSTSVAIGAQVAQVDEPRTVFIFELEAYPEAKALSPVDLRALYEVTGSFYEVADIIGTSEGFARQNAKGRR